LVSVLDSEASLVNERHADDASRVRNLAGAVDCDLLPVAALQRPRLPGELHFLDDAGAIDAGNDARCKADISGIGAVQQARIGMPALDHHEHAALGHGTRFTSSQTAWARFRLVMVVSIVKGPETTHALGRLKHRGMMTMALTTPSIGGFAPGRAAFIVGGART